MYSALRAEVEDPTDMVNSTTGLRETAMNTDLVMKLKIADKLLLCGQALSHCVNYTMSDLANYFEDKSKLFVLKDGKIRLIYSFRYL